MFRGRNHIPEVHIALSSGNCGRISHPTSEAAQEHREGHSVETKAQDTAIPFKELAVAWERFLLE